MMITHDPSVIGMSAIDEIATMIRCLEASSAPNQRNIGIVGTDCTIRWAARTGSGISFDRKLLCGPVASEIPSALTCQK
jgi:hypothetical protein